VSAPVGAVVRIYYDGLAVDRGDALRTPTGRTYVVMDKREQRRGAHVGRQHLVCLVASEAPPTAMVRPLHWYPRKVRKVRNQPALREAK
jgi:hypothetical protein